MTIQHYNKIIVGGSLAALLYAYKNKIPVVWVSPRIPSFFEVDERGNSKQQLWHKLAFQLSLSGAAPMAPGGTSIRVEDNNILKLFTDGPFFATLRFGELIVFDDTQLEGWDNELGRAKKYRVLDWINDRQSSPHKVEKMISDDDLAREVYFYPSHRIDGNWSGKKDMVAVSYLNRKQIDSVEYCDTYVRFKVLHMMKEAGIRGPKNGVNKKDPTKHNYLSVKIETARREVETIIIPPFDEDELLQDFELRNRHLDG